MVCSTVNVQLQGQRVNVQPASQPAVCCFATDLSVPGNDYVQFWTLILDLILCLGDYLNILDTGSLSIIRYIDTNLLGL